MHVQRQTSHKKNEGRKTLWVERRALHELKRKTTCITKLETLTEVPSARTDVPSQNRSENLCCYARAN